MGAVGKASGKVILIRTQAVLAGISSAQSWRPRFWEIPSIFTVAGQTWNFPTIPMKSPNQLHRLATHYVSAKAQAMLVTLMLEENLLTEKEQEIYKRGRNANANTKAKNTDIVTYKMSTGFEAIMGYLHMTEQIERLEELIDWCIATVENLKKRN